MKTKLSILAGFLVSGLLLWLALRNVPMSGLAEAYARVNIAILLPAGLAVVFEMFLRGVKWRLLLLPSNPSVRAVDAFKLQAAGMALNNILPLRLGELARATFAAKIFNIPLITVLATIFVERLLDVIVLLMMFAAAAVLGDLSGGFTEYRGFLLSLVAMLAGGIAVLIFAEEIVAHAWFSGLFARFPRLRSLFEHIAMGVRGFHTLRGGAAILGFATLQWCVNALSLWLLALAFGLGGVVSIFRSVALLFATAVACSIPSAPGFFGNYELMFTKVLSGWGVPETAAFACASFSHVFAYLLITLVGVVFIYQMGQSLSGLWGQFSKKGGEGSPR